MNAIKIFKGNDTNFNDGKFLIFTLNSTIDLSSFSGIFTLGSFKAVGNLKESTMEVIIPASASRQFPLGQMNGTFTLVDTANRVATVSNTIPFEITSTVFTPGAETVDLEVPPGYPVNISMQLGVEYATAAALNSAVSDLNEDISAEALARQSADDSLSRDIVLETQARQSETGTLSTNLNNEVSARQLADKQISDLLTAETEARQFAEADLQGQIDGLAAAQNVHDIVGTYADLQAYDTSALHANEIIKVLVDSTHSNAASYYNWTGSDWDYVGSEGPYSTPAQTQAAKTEAVDTANSYTDNAILPLATKQEVNDGLSAKQDTISDLGTIRSGAAAGATALQSVPYATSTTAGGVRLEFDRNTGTLNIINED